MRQIVLDTETTGLSPAQGHRVIEIGCVELLNRRLTGNHFHQYIQPDREIDNAAFEVHGISQSFLEDKPRFEDISKDFLSFVKDAELIIHNASFDVGFLEAELKKTCSKVNSLSKVCKITDSLKLARDKHPGQRNSLDALCKRYGIDNSQRTLHGALLDAEILADVYLIMTGGQSSFFADAVDGSNDAGDTTIDRVSSARPLIAIVKASSEDVEQHDHFLGLIDKKSDGQCLWLKQDAE